MTIKIKEIIITGIFNWTLKTIMQHMFDAQHHSQTIWQTNSINIQHTHAFHIKMPKRKERKIMFKKWQSIGQMDKQ